MYFFTASSKKGGLVRLHSFHKTTQVQSADLDPSEQKYSETAKPTDSSFEGANLTNTVESNVTEDLLLRPQTESTEEHEDASLPPFSKAEAQVISRDNQNAESIPEFANQDTPLMPSAMATNQFSADVCVPDAQSNFSVPLPGVTSVPATNSNPLSPFIPKKRSLEEERVVSDLIHFSDNPEPGDKGVDVGVAPTEVRGDAIPSEEIQLVEEPNQAVEKEWKLSNARQPSLESDQSAIIVSIIVPFLRPC